MRSAWKVEGTANGERLEFVVLTRSAIKDDAQATALGELAALVRNGESEAHLQLHKIEHLGRVRESALSLDS